MTIGRSPDAGVFLDDVTVSRNHALLVQAPRRPLHRRPRLAQRHLRQPAPDRVPQAQRRRRAPGRQVQAHLPGALDGGADARPRRTPSRAGSPAPDALTERARPRASRSRSAPSASCSSARVPGHLDLEDPLPRGPEAALAAAHAGRLPALLAGGRRPPAHDPAPAARRVPAAAGDPPGARRRARAEDAGASAGRAATSAAARSRSTSSAEPSHTLDELIEDTGADERLVRELEEYGLDHAATARDGERATTSSTARSSARSASSRATASRRATCASSGPRPTARPRCSSRSSAPALRSRNRERRKEAVETLESLAAVVSHLKHLLLVRDLRQARRLSAGCRGPGAAA